MRTGAVTEDGYCVDIFNFCHQGCPNNNKRKERE